MYRINYSHRGSALIIALIVVVLLTIMTTTFLEKVLNLGKMSGGINYSAQSYSVATWLIEEQLMDSNMTKESPWNIVPVSQNYSFSGRSLIAATGGTWMPVDWKWNSTFDSDWNIISMGEPIQIVIPENITWGNVEFYFRVPSIQGAVSTGNLASITNSGIILWTFGYSGSSLYASGESNIFKWQDITWNIEKIESFNGITNTWSNSTFINFYTDGTIGVGTNGAKCTSNYQCTLKLSMIRPFLTQWWQIFPFLEYRINFNRTIPSQYMVIDSSANMYGFLRSRQVRIQQITTSTAADFAILQ